MMRTQLVLLAPLLAGCPDRPISGVPVEQGKVETKDIPSVPQRDIDVLFMIDSSRSMEDEQASLKANFPRFVSVLESIEGGLPNIHLGVITPDLGTQALDGAATGITGCTATGGSKGILHGIPGGPLFLSDVADGAGGRTRNYTGTLADQFSLLADVGIKGCGIEQHLEAVKVALDNNPANAGFLRKDALLAVVLVADEDDCSLAQRTLFDVNPSDPAYPELVNFRCTKEGIECDTPSTTLDTPGPRKDCHPKADSTLLTHVDRYATFLKGLKTNERDVIVAGIIGDPEPFATMRSTMSSATVLAPSCKYNGPNGEQNAFPAVRMANFLQQFPSTNTRTTICDADLSGGLTQVAAAIKGGFGDPCFYGQPADVDLTTPGNQYDCTVTEYRPKAGGGADELRVFQQCGTGQTPCWHIEEDAVNCSYTPIDPHLKIVIDRGSEAPDPSTRLAVDCVTTSDGP